MHIEALKIIMAEDDLSQSDIARIAGVSRQAVSLWFKQGRENPFINIQTFHLMKLANSLNVQIEQLMSVPKIMGDEIKKNELSARFNWDKRYPNIETFFCACVRGEPRALGRLVENIGLFRSAKIVGKSIWNKFDQFKKWLPPIRQKECEKIWELQKNLKLI